MTALAPLCLLLAGLAFTVFNDAYISRKHRRIMLLVVLFSAVLIAQNLVEDGLAAGQPRPLFRTAASVLGYSVRPVILILFLDIVRPERKHPAAWCMAAVNAAVYLTAFFSRLCFWISADNHYHRGPLANTCLIVSLALLAALLYQSVRDYHTEGKWAQVLPCMVVLMILASVFMDYRVGLEGQQPVTFLTTAIVTGSVFYYIWLHMQFVRAHEREVAAGQQTQIMLSQIQPHFLYNTLGVIREVCYSDPQRAGDAIDEFADFLRHNMDSIKEDKPIPFRTELTHVRHYVSLQKLRFGDKLTVEYDIADDDFDLPTLTIQPLVENAIRYGVRRNPDGRGTVTVRTRAYPDRVEVSVTDDGPGFADVETVDGSRSHVGLQNVRNRLHYVCGGELRVACETGKGTVATIVLPKREGQ